MADGTADNDNLIGTSANDTLNGLAGDDSVQGLAGSDLLTGGEGNDSLYGGTGQDTLNGGAGDDLLDGGPTDSSTSLDFATFTSATGPQVIDLVAGTATGDGTDTLVSIEGVLAGNFDDKITGNGDLNILRGNLGDDTIDGGAGSDYADYWGASGGVTVSLVTNTSTGAAGNDVLINIERIRGSDSDDSLTGDANENYLRGMQGNDTLDGGEGSDWADYFQATAGVNVDLAAGHSTGANSGADGTDTFVSIENILGSVNKSDTLTGDSGANILVGSGGNDVLSGGGGNDQLYGDSGSDSLSGGAGNDTLNGGTIFDTINYSDLNFVNYSGAASGVNVNLGMGTASDGDGGTDTLFNINFVRGSSHDDVLTGGTNWYEQFEGGAGNDTIDGGALSPSQGNRVNYQNASGSVTVNLGTGSASGADGVDVLVNINAVRGSNSGDQLTGSDRTDFFETFDGRGGDDVIDGKGGTDVVRYDHSTTSVVVDLSLGTASGGTVHGNDSLAGIENVRGSLGGDVITGDGFANHLDGRDGNDTLNGGAGNDTVVGGLNEDYLQGGDDADNLDGQNHSDVMYGEAGNDYIQAFGGLELENDYIDGGDGHDIASYNFGWVTGPVNFTSSGSGTTLRAQTDINGGSDTLVNIEEVHIFGSNAGDVLTGDTGRNYMSGNGGNDTLTGGGGHDTFSYWVAPGATYGTDLITDLGQYDDLSFSNIQLEGPVLSGADGSAMTKGQMMVGGFNGSTTKVFVGTDDAAGADIVIDLQGDHAATDFFVHNDFWGTWVQFDPAVNLVGGSGNDDLSGGQNNDTIDGADGNDNLNGNGGNDMLFGGKGDDFIGGGPGVDSLYGGVGNDYIFAGGSWDGGNDVIDGGEGTDIVNYGYQGAVDPIVFTATVDSGQQIDPMGGTDQLNSIEELHFFGGDAGDTFVGDGLRSYIQGRGGNDTLTGGGGSDTFSYDPLNVPDSGVDRIKDFGLGDSLDFQSVTLDTTIQSGSDPAGLGEGQVRISSTVSGVTTLWVGTSKATGGYVTIELEGTYSASNFGVYNGSFGGGLSYVQPGWLVGHFGRDTISGGEGNDTIYGLEGDDQLNGYAGNDSLNGGSGGDYIDSGAGSDTVDGGAGYDIASMNFGDQTAPVTFTAADGGTQVDPFGGTDVLSNIEELHIFGGEGADTLGGNSLRNFIGGNGGNDTLTGGAGQDTFFFYAGRNDNGTDLITDLQAGEDIAFGQVAGFTVTGIASGEDASALGKGQVLFHTPADGKTKVSVGLDDAAGADLTFSLAGSYAATNFDLYNQPWGSGITYTPGMLVVGDNNSNNLNGSSGADTIQGLGGDDYINGGADGDAIDGGAGNDWVFHDGATGGVVVNLASGSVTGGTGNDTLTGIEYVGGSPYDDSITGDGNNNVIQGRGGNDTLDGGAGSGDNVDYYNASGAVTVNLGTGSASGADGSDVLSNFENVTGSFHDDSITGNGGNNFLVGLGGNDTIDGGAGFDAIGFWDATAGVEVNLAAGSVTGGSGSDTLISIENANGSNHADKLTGDAGNNNLRGEGGNDTLQGGAGSDNLNGGAGDDQIDGGAILDRTNYTDLNSIEYMNATSGVDVNLQTGTALDGLGGTDTLANINFVTGSVHHDKITGSIDAIFEQFEGRGGNDTIDGGVINAANNFNSNRVTYQNATSAVQVDLGAGSVTGGDGNDTLININYVRGSNHADLLIGSDVTAYSETFEGRGGNDTINGMGGIDWLRLDGGTTGAVVDLAAGTSQDGQGGLDTLISIENVRGFDHNDHITGDANNNELQGRGGNDTLIGGVGGDFLVGGVGDDSLDGGAHDMNLGMDVASYTGASGAVNVNLATGLATGAEGNDTLIGIEALRGGGFDDVLVGDANLNFLRGGLGNDTLDGGDGFDYADYASASAAVTVNLATGSATGADGTDVLSNFEAIRGSAHADHLTGSSVNNRLRGGGGDDTLDGGEGVDAADYREASAGVTVNLAMNTATGGDGSDTLISIESVRGSVGYGDSLTGNSGSNTIEGLGGDDTLTGGGGADKFVWLSADSFPHTHWDMEGVDTITDFGTDDTIHVGVVLSAGTPAAGDGSTVAGNGVQVAAAGGVTTLSIDVDGVAGAEIQIKLNGEFAASTFTVKDNGNGTSSITRVPGLSLVGTAGPDSLVGGPDNDTLDGAAGNDTLDGGLGADRMVGRTGDDTYYVDSAQDVVIEFGGEGNDTVITGTTVTLADNVENLTLTGSANLTGTGSAVGNVITGNTGANLLRGEGGHDSIFGADGADTLDGGTGNDTLEGQGGVDRFVGRAGDDTFVINDSTEVVVEFASEGIDTALASVSYTLGDNVERLTLTGTDNLNGVGNVLANTIVGNAGHNSLSGAGGVDTISGGEGNDTLDGGYGADKLTGGLGDDTYVVDNASEVVTEAAAEGVDTILSSITFAVAPNVENLTLTGTLLINASGNALANVITGNVSANQLTGGDGSDTLIGGGGHDTLDGGLGNDSLDGGTGDDRMVGRTGDDTYVVNSALDTIIEFGGEGSDSVYAAATYTLAANVENLTLTGSAGITGTGNTLANVITGNVGANLLRGDAGHDSVFGGDGADTLDGGTGNDTLQGDAGVDRFVGRAGDDTFIVDDSTEVIVEFGSEGIDTVLASVSYTLPAEVERLTLTGSANINGTGNVMANIMFGNDGANNLIGAGGLDTLTGGLGNDTLDGGTGGDRLVGGAGDDTYVMDNINEVIVENLGEGVDTVQSSVTAYLSANVENLTLTGSGTINGTGNALDNALTGNGANNLLVGGDGADSLSGVLGNDTLDGGLGNDTLDGGVGADRMVGRAGNDSYVVDNAGDVIVEFAGDGTDAVLASVSYTLAANVENLTLDAALAINGTGNALSNYLTGSAGVNALNGAGGNDTLEGGDSDDSLTGGTGADTFVFSDASGVDTINDFAVGDGDVIQLQAGLNGSTIVDAASALAATSNVGGNAVVDLGGGNTVTLVGVLKEALSEACFSVS
jgi:Ca2+-binding RTX toxin-like protein